MSRSSRPRRTRTMKATGGARAARPGPPVWQGGVAPLVVFAALEDDGFLAIRVSGDWVRQRMDLALHAKTLDYEGEADLRLVAREQGLFRISREEVGEPRLRSAMDDVARTGSYVVVPGDWAPATVAGRAGEEQTFEARAGTGELCWSISGSERRLRTPLVPASDLALIGLRAAPDEDVAPLFAQLVRAEPRVAAEVVMRGLPMRGYEPATRNVASCMEPESLSALLAADLPRTVRIRLLEHLGQTTPPRVPGRTRRRG